MGIRPCPACPAGDRIGQEAVWGYRPAIDQILRPGGQPDLGRASFVSRSGADDRQSLAVQRFAWRYRSNGAPPEKID